MALVATITIALCTLAVMVVDGEDAIHLVEAVKMRAHTAIRRSASWMNGAMKRTPTLAEVSKLTPHDQQRLLSELKSRKQSLKKVLRTNAQRAKYSHETWDAADASDTGAGKDVVLTGTNMVEGVQQRQEYVNDRALEQTAASILVDVRRQESYDLRRRQQVESDEDELEEEQTTAFQQKMEEKDRKNKQKIKQLEEKLRDLQGKKDATNKNTAAKVESKQEAVSTVTTPDVEIQEDALQLPSNQQNQQLPSNAAEQQQVDNNRVAELTAQIAQLKQQRRKTPLNPSENSEQPTEKFQEEPAIVDIETSVKAEDVPLPKKKTNRHALSLPPSPPLWRTRWRNLTRRHSTMRRRRCFGRPKMKSSKTNVMQPRWCPRPNLTLRRRSSKMNQWASPCLARRRRLPLRPSMVSCTMLCGEASVHS